MTISLPDHRAETCDDNHALWLARAAALAYQDGDEARERVPEWGFDRFRHFTTPHRPPFPIEDTQAYVAGSGGMVVVAFRGTEPVRLRDWLSDAGTLLAPHGSGKGMVHVGFEQALGSVHDEIAATVDEFRDGDQRVWFTGHSLGGALAMLAAARTHLGEPGAPVAGVCTFGQPRTCDPFLAGAYDEVLGDRTLRYVNNSDIVPQVPPAPLFQHVGAVRYFDATGRMRDRLPLTTSVLDKARGHTADPFAPGHDGVRDHSMQVYTALLEKRLA